MPIPSAGRIELGRINDELLRSSATQISLNDSDVRSLLQTPSGAISLLSARGKSFLTPTLTYNIANPNTLQNSFRNFFAGGQQILGDFVVSTGGTNGVTYSGGITGEDYRNSNGKVYVHSLTTGNLVRTIDNPNPSSTTVFAGPGEFLYSVRGKSNLIAVGGATSWSGMSSASSGIGEYLIYIFDITTGSLIRTINNPMANGSSSMYHYFSALDLDNNYIVAGAMAAPTGNSSGLGRIYVYNSVGSLLYTINNPIVNSNNNFGFGYTAKISNNFLVVGDGTQNRIYIYNITNGSLLRTIINPDSSTMWLFGQRIAVSGNNLIATAFPTNGSSSTPTRVYTYNITNGSLISTIRSNLVSALSTNNRGFGSALALDGNLAVILAPQVLSANSVNVGAVYLFNVMNVGEYSAVLHGIINPNGYGGEEADLNNLSLSGNYLSIGAPSEDDAFRTFSGRLYVYKLRNI